MTTVTMQPNYLNAELTFVQKAEIYAKTAKKNFFDDVVSNIKMAKSFKTLSELFADTFDPNRATVITNALGSYLSATIILKMASNVCRAAQFALSQLTGGNLNDGTPISYLSFLRDFSSEYVADVASFLLLFNPACIPLRVAYAFSDVLYGVLDITDAISYWMNTDTTTGNQFDKQLANEKWRNHMLNVAKAICSIISDLLGLGIALNAAGKLTKWGPAMMRYVPSFAKRTVIQLAMNAPDCKKVVSQAGSFFGLGTKLGQKLQIDKINETYLKSETGKQAMARFAARTA